MKQRFTLRYMHPSEVHVCVHKRHVLGPSQQLLFKPKLPKCPSRAEWINYEMFTKWNSKHQCNEQAATT